MYFDGLSQEQQERLRSCETPDEMLKAARELGMELSEDQLDGIAGGDSGELWYSTNVCNYYDITHCGQVSG